jgi:hypothetical protein
MRSKNQPNGNNKLPFLIAVILWFWLLFLDSKHMGPRGQSLHPPALLTGVDVRGKRNRELPLRRWKGAVDKLRVLPCDMNVHLRLVLAAKTKLTESILVLKHNLQ